MKNLRSVFLSIVLLSLISGCNFHINKSIRVESGRRSSGSKNTINGNINIGSDCDIYGSCRSINGHIRVGRLSRVKTLQTINGSIDIDGDVKINGDVESINGGIQCSQGVEVNGNVQTINGRIDLERTTVENDISTYNGDILLLDRSRVRGDIVINRNRGKSSRWRHLKIEISDESEVEGDLIIKDRDIEVTVYLVRGGRIRGEIDGRAEIVRR